MRELAAGGQRVIVVGDSINDAPAKAAALVGIAMAGAGARPGGVMTCTTRADQASGCPAWPGSGYPPGSVQGTNVVITQRVEDVTVAGGRRPRYRYHGHAARRPPARTAPTRVAADRIYTDSTAADRTNREPYW